MKCSLPDKELSEPTGSNSSWTELLRKYSVSRKPCGLNFRFFMRRAVSNGRADSYTHFIHSYPGKILRHIPSFLLNIANLCPEEGVVLDPFCGSGTVLLESLLSRKQKSGTFGVEINPLGRLVSKVKTTLIEVEVLDQKLGDYLGFINDKATKASIPEYSKMGFWFSKPAIEKLGVTRHQLECLPADDVSDLIWLSFSSIVRKVSLADPYVPPPIKLKPSKFPQDSARFYKAKELLQRNQDPPVLEMLNKEVAKNVEKLKTLQGAPKANSRPEIIWKDAREIRIGRMGYKGRFQEGNAKLLDGKSIDLIITSPPYLSAQKYIRSQKLQLIWLGLLTESEVRVMEREIIGSEHTSAKELSTIAETGSRKADDLIEWAKRKSPEVACRTYKYFHNMTKAMHEFHRVLKDGGHLVMILGNNRLLGRPIRTYRYLIDLADQYSMKPKIVLRDKIRGRGMFTTRNDSGGLITDEYVVVLEKV